MATNPAVATADVAPRAPERPAARGGSGGTYRRWVLATTLGELVAFSVPTLVWGLSAVAGLHYRIAYAPVVLAGGAEGAILGWAQTRALRHDLPALDVRAWVRRTAAAGAVSWAIGMSPSAWGEPLSALPAALLGVLGAAGAAVLLGSIGLAQATVLHRHVEHAGRWVGANVLAWVAGLPLSFLALAVAPAHPAALRAAFAIAGGVAMGATVAAVTGLFLVRLLRHPRPDAPAAR